MNSYFSQLKTRIKAEYEATNKSKLEKYNAGKLEKDQFRTYEALEMHMYNLLNLFTSNKTDFSNNNDDEKRISNELLDQYEEIKENDVIVGLVNKISDNNYIVFIIIFENEVVYENILLKEFNDIDESRNYFSELKTLIKNNNIDNLSKIILEKIFEVINLNLVNIDLEINNCNRCLDMVEKFPNSKTVSIGKKNDIVILGEAPANNGWRKSGVAFYDANGKLLPSGIVLEKLLSQINLTIQDVYFTEAIKCYPKDRKYLKKCSDNCKNFLFKQLDIIKPKVVLCLGDAATKTIIDIKYKNFSDIVGKEFNINGMKVIPIYHPSPISPMSYKGNIDIFKKIKL